MNLKDDYQQKEEAVSVNQNQEQQTEQNGYVEDQSEQGLEEAAWAAKVQGGKKPNKTGLPDELKEKMEQLHQFDLSKVRVHYNSDKPDLIGAVAYAEGWDIYIAPGEEHALEHELAHVIDQLKGLAKETTEIGGQAIDGRTQMEERADKGAVEAKKDENSTNQQQNDLMQKEPTAVVQPMLGFGKLKEPEGYGAVVLSAGLNGINLGKAWSKKTTYSSGTEHAEDAVVDFIEYLEAILEFPALQKGATDDEIRLAQTLPGKKELVIHGLTASPCTSEERDGLKVTTCKKGDMEGCTERLIGLVKRGYAITLHVDHLYQPKVKGGKKASLSAVEEMRKQGIKVILPK
jgi:hypothetical protein